MNEVIETVVFDLGFDLASAKSLRGIADCAGNCSVDLETSLDRNLQEFYLESIASGFLSTTIAGFFTCLAAASTLHDLNYSWIQKDYNMCLSRCSAHNSSSGGSSSPSIE